MAWKAAYLYVSRQIFQNAYLGYRIFYNHWGKGYGTEAVRLAIDIAFRNLNLHRLEAAIEPTNKRSIALAKAVGMERESFSKRRLYFRGKWTDFILYVIRSEDLGIEWKPRKEPLLMRREKFLKVVDR